MKNASPKLLKVIRLQLAAAMINCIAAAIIAVGLINYFFTDISFFTALILSIACSWAFLRVLNVITLVAIQVYVYRSNVDEAIADAKKFNSPVEELEENEVPKLTLEKSSITVINTPEKPIGRFMDKSFFEWLIIDDGIHGPRKYVFSGTTQMKDDSMIDMVLSPGSIIMKPGIIYQVDHQ